MKTTLCLILIALLPLASCTKNRDDAGKEEQSSSTQSPAKVNPDNIVIPQLTKDNFDAHISQGKFSFLEFGGKSCTPCKKMQPILRQLQATFPDVRVGLIYNEDSKELLEQWGIQLIPTQIVLGADKKEITRHVGLWEYDDLVTELKAKGVIQ